MDIRPVSQAVGAEVSGVDLARIDDEQLAAIDQAWAEYGVLFFHDQHLSPDEHLALGERLGGIDVNRFFEPVDGHPRIAQVRKEPDQDENIGGGWHTDHSYDQIPARGSILRAIEVPEVGGDTRFLSVGAAYRSLPAELKERIASLEAEHSNRHVFSAEAAHQRGVGDRLSNPEEVGDAVHPVVIAHPVTGEPLLYVNMAFTTNFVGETRDESKPLLDELYTHIMRDEFSYQFQWRPGSVAMWDNRSTWHWALNDYPGQRRLMHRITVSGGPLSAAA